MDVLRRFNPLVVLLLLVSAPTAGSGKEPSFRAIDYASDVKPLLKAHCVSCHGGLKQEGGLRVDTGALARRGGDSGPAVVPGKPATSALIQRIRSADPKQRMPLAEKPLDAAAIAILEAWVKSGALSPVGEEAEPDSRDHWAFRRPVRASPPPANAMAWPASPIDAFLAAGRERAGLRASRPASPYALLRRVTLDLIGVPPTRRQVRGFLADPSETAYARVVDRLLADPRYGERWGRHWMDVWRYSDWYGRRSVNDVRNSYPHIWRWRDWIIESLNQDHGYDRMVREMIAADELTPTDDRAIAGTGYIVRNWFSLNYDQWMKDLVEHTGKAFLALRLNCAHCHDHKYDPISQDEYFRFRAFFEPLEFRHDRVPGGPALTKYKRYTPGSGASLKPIAAGLPRVFDENLVAKTFRYMGGDARNKDKDSLPLAPAAPAFLGGEGMVVARIDLPLEAWNPSLKDSVVSQERAVRVKALKQAEAAGKNMPAADDSGKRKLIDEVAAARKRLARAQAAVAAHRKRSPREKAARQFARVERKRLLGEWRFEGQDAAGGFLADSSGRGGTLRRVKGKAPKTTLKLLDQQGSGAWFPAEDLNRLVPNRQAARFQQVNGIGYLATDVRPEMGAPEFTLEALVHIRVSMTNFNAGIAECEGAWTWLHRGLDATTSELRLIMNHVDGSKLDVATRPELLLKTGHDYYVALAVDAGNVRMFVHRLDGGEPSIGWEVPRAKPGTVVPALAKPTPAGTFKIGNSGNGTGRHQGLIDEVNYWKGALPKKRIVARAAGSAVQKEFVNARLAFSRAEAALAVADVGRLAIQRRTESARRELVAYEARVAAERAVGTGDQGQIARLARKATTAEWQARRAAAEASLSQAEIALAHVPEKNSQDRGKAKKAVEAARKSLKQAQAEPTDTTRFTPLGPIYPRQSTGRRRALAEWLTDAGNPLTARVAVNHIWLRHFGRPLVESVFDFGRAGSPPTHPKLLDWLAVELMQRHWSMKHLHRLIVLSRSYRMSSHDEKAAAVNAAVDPDNRLWWKWETRRNEAEVVRDSLLAVSEKLDLRIGGPEVDNRQETATRRSLYFAHYPEAGGTMKFLSLFDAADPGDCYRRSETIVPQQALAMANSSLALGCSRVLGRALWAEVGREPGGDRDARFLHEAFLQVLARPPSDREQLACRLFLSEQESFFRTAGVASLKKVVKGEEPPSSDPVVRARESLVRVLLNHTEFVTIP